MTDYFKEVKSPTDPLIARAIDFVCRTASIDREGISIVSGNDLELFKNGSPLIINCWDLITENPTTVWILYDSESDTFSYSFEE